MGIGYFCGFNYLIFCYIFYSEGDVVENSVVEKDGFLRHDAH
jgi:hypothetical protein